MDGVLLAIDPSLAQIPPHDEGQMSANPSPFVKLKSGGSGRDPQAAPQELSVSCELVVGVGSVVPLQRFQAGPLGVIPGGANQMDH